MKLEDLEISVYILNKEPIITLDRVGSRTGDRWAIRSHGECLNNEGEWEYEPLPSNRDDEFYARCRWLTPEDALAFWEQFDKKTVDRR